MSFKRAYFKAKLLNLGADIIGAGESANYYMFVFGDGDDDDYTLINKQTGKIKNATIWGLGEPFKNVEDWKQRLRG